MIRTDLIRPIPELLARADPDKLAFKDSSRSVSYGELRDRTARLAAGLGVSRGDRVAIYLKNGVPFVESYLAIARAGAIGVPINSAAAPA
ncbi:MAG TPA: AMP-binding protein, partial [Thermoleophilaceae bacterium]